MQFRSFEDSSFLDFNMLLTVEIEISKNEKLIASAFHFYKTGVNGVDLLKENEVIFFQVKVFDCC